jgi:hypothetical protein
MRQHTRVGTILTQVIEVLRDDQFGSIPPPAQRRSVARRSVSASTAHTPMQCQWCDRLIPCAMWPGLVPRKLNVSAHRMYSISSYGQLVLYKSVCTLTGIRTGRSKHWDSIPGRGRKFVSSPKGLHRFWATQRAIQWVRRAVSQGLP